MGKTATPHFRGTTKECLAHYASTLPQVHNRRVRDALAPLADFTGRRKATVYHWLRRERPVLGFNLVKVRYFLEQQGYQVIELKNLIPAVRDLGRLIAHGVLTIEEVVKELSYTGRTHFLEVLHGDRLSPKRMKTIHDIVETYLPLLEKRVRGLARLYDHPHQKEEPTTKPDVEEEPAYTPVSETDRAPGIQGVGKETVSTVNGDTEHRVLIVALAKQLEAITPLAELVLSDLYTPDERIKVREIVDVFRASNALNQLCGETARRLKPAHWHKASSNRAKNQKQ